LWTPIQVTLGGVDRLEQSKLVILVRDGDGVPYRVAYPLADWSEAGAEATERVALVYARFGRVRPKLTIELRRGDQLLARRTWRAGQTEGFRESLLSAQKLIVAVGVDGAAVEEATRLERREPAARPVVAEVSGLAELPTRWYGYEGVYAVVLGTTRPELLAGAGLDAPGLKALDRWVQSGGRLILCLGRSADRLLGGSAPSGLVRFVPARSLQMVQLRQMGALETYTSGAVPIPRLGRGGRVRVPRLRGIQGKVEVREGNVPLVIRTARGFGHCVLLATDLDEGPIAGWRDRPLLVSRLLDLATKPLEDRTESTAVMHYGYTDLAGQFRSALDRFEGVWLIPFSVVVVLIGIYVLLIGPADYFLVHKVFRRARLTWVTFPLVVALVSAAAYGIARRFKGTRVAVSQVAVLDFDAAGGRVRGTAWMNVFSPRMERYEMVFQPQVPGDAEVSARRAMLTWLGLPGQALGGMNPKAAEPAVWQQPYDVPAELDAMHGVPIPVWSTKSFTARWQSRGAVLLKADLRWEDQLPSGTIRNGYPFALADCLLAAGRWAYELGTLAPGQSVRIDSRSKRRSLKALLTGQRLVLLADNKPRQTATPYDRASLDLKYILRMMMFYEAAGGRLYTGLEHQYQQFVDLSGLLRTDRAVLVAYPSQEISGGRLLCGGKPLVPPPERRVTVCRFVLPVRSAENE